MKELTHVVVVLFLWLSKDVTFHTSSFSQRFFAIVIELFDSGWRSWSISLFNVLEFVCLKEDYLWVWHLFISYQINVVFQLLIDELHLPQISHHLAVFSSNRGACSASSKRIIVSHLHFFLSYKFLLNLINSLKQVTVVCILLVLDPLFLSLPLLDLLSKHFCVITSGLLIRIWSVSARSVLLWLVLRYSRCVINLHPSGSIDLILRLLVGWKRRVLHCRRWILSKIRGCDASSARQCSTCRLKIHRRLL